MVSCKSTKKAVLSNDYPLEIMQHRVEYKEEFLKDTRGPLKKEGLHFLDFYAPNQAYQCDCKFMATPDAKPFEMSTYSGQTKPFKSYGVADCVINGEHVDVNIYSSIRVQAMPGYEDYLFMPFKDYTNSESTYGGGRYIDLRMGNIQNGRVSIDFNKSYNPWCAYSDGYNCPIPPIENHFTMEILAGEKMWKGKKKG